MKNKFLAKIIQIAALSIALVNTAIANEAGDFTRKLKSAIENKFR